MPMFLLKGFLREGSLACLCTLTPLRAVTGGGSLGAEALAALLPGFLFPGRLCLHHLVTVMSYHSQEGTFTPSPAQGPHNTYTKNLEFVSGQVASSTKRNVSQLSPLW